MTPPISRHATKARTHAGAYGSTDLHWQARGNCVTLRDPELFFPVGNPEKTKAAAEQTRDAKAVCAGTTTGVVCPVMDRCLAEALRRGDQHGVYGGLSEDERRSLKRRQQRQSRVQRPA